MSFSTLVVYFFTVLKITTLKKFDKFFYVGAHFFRCIVSTDTDVPDASDTQTGDVEEDNDNENDNDTNDSSGEKNNDMNEEQTIVPLTEAVTT